MLQVSFKEGVTRSGLCSIPDGYRSMKQIAVALVASPTRLRGVMHGRQDIFFDIKNVTQESTYYFSTESGWKTHPMKLDGQGAVATPQSNSAADR